MTNRVLEISETGAFLRLKNRLIEIKFDNGELYTLPVEELGVLLLSNPSLTLTQPLLSAIVESGGMIVLCDSRYLPSGMLLPFGSHSIAAANYQDQVSASEPTKKQIWKQIVQKKIEFQSRLLKYTHQDDAGLKGLIKRVQSGDTSNLEGQAARRYWKALFGDQFIRHRDAQDHNRYLNYGYTVLRACTARAICSVGLHPSFGIHHHNRYDAFRLADDLMEPFRPLVDKKCFEIYQDNGAIADLDKAIKRPLLEILSDSLILKKQRVSLFQALSELSHSVLDVFQKRRKKVVLPDALWV